MKLGTDSVMLGVFARAQNASKVLDIGTGTGVLALMMAQKCNAQIDAVEIDEQAYLQAAENVEASVWRERIRVYHSDISGFDKDKNNYDLVISNPPYYRAGRNMKIEDLQRSKARHDADLPFETLCDEVTRRLSPAGSFYLVLPSREATDFMGLVEKKSLYLNRVVYLRSKEGKAPNRYIMCFGKTQQATEEEAFTIYNEDGGPTAAYIQATKDFYLWKQFDAGEELKW
jgi:tRNA1Val (adenine37-N6)-methyltransferase